MPLNPSDLIISSVFEDSRTNLWLGTKSGLLKLENGRFTPVYGPEELSHEVTAMHEDSTGKVWFGTATELICKTRDQFAIHHLRTDRGSPDIRSIVEDKLGNLWIGTLGQGLFVLPRGKAESSKDHSLDRLLEQHGFDRVQHEQIRADLKAGRIGLPQNR